MATAKALQAERMNKAADRLDWLMANARVLRSPALWESTTKRCAWPGFWASR